MATLNSPREESLVDTEVEPEKDSEICELIQSNRASATPSFET
eukprot:COSAG02_NODE_43197_length_377_cov_0.741007_1_plen_42_part_10